MKIVHLTVVRQLSQGQLKQLRYEYEASQKLDDVQWKTVAYHNGLEHFPYVRRTPFFFRAMFLRNFWAWIVALHFSKRTDFLLFRHITFDPFAFVFSPFVSNRISVHHAKEIEELRLIRKGWTGRLASLLERYSGKFSIKRALGVAGVTREIANYECSVNSIVKPVFCLPNGIDFDSVSELVDQRKDDRLNAAFVCGNFSAWHGLDKLMAALDVYVAIFGAPRINIHLIGKLSDFQISSIKKNEVRREVFKIHGSMSEDAYREILAECHIGIASLAMERQNLTEGSTLKVREMLAMGLPIYSGHHDIALDDKLTWILVDRTVDFSRLLNFAESVRHVNRSSVRSASIEKVSKLHLMKNFVNELKPLARFN